MRLLLALAALCAGVSATSQDSEAREVARVAADAIARAATGSFAETPGRALGAGKCCGRAAKCSRVEAGQRGGRRQGAAAWPFGRYRRYPALPGTELNCELNTLMTCSAAP